MKRLMAVLMLGAVLAGHATAQGAAADDAPEGYVGQMPDNDKLEVLAEHKVIATFGGVKFRRCMGKTGRCPDKCGSSGNFANFKVTDYLHFKKPGKYGDDKSESYSAQISDFHRKPRGDPGLLAVIESLDKGDQVVIEWKHLYGEVSPGLFGPVRPLLLLKKIDKEQAKQLIDEAAAVERELRERGIELSPKTKLRIVSYNTYFTSVFPKDNGELRDTRFISDKKIDVAERVRQFASWAKQARADIFALQETIYLEEDREDTTAKGIGTYFSKVTGQDWHCAADGFGRVVLSRHPIRWSGRVKNARGMAAWIDLPDAISKTDMLLINIHFLSGTKHIRHRKSQATNLVNFINAVRAGTHEGIPKDIPIVICGDFNSDASDVPHNIVAKQDPDAKQGDGKAVHYVNPRPVELTSKREHTFGRVTWSGGIGDSDFTGPDKTLDHILVQKDFMAVDQAFVFNSLITPKDVLERYGVEREALLLVRDGQVEELDHLPVFVDLKSKEDRH